MDELKFFTGLSAITIFVIGLFVYFGRKFSKTAERNAAYIGLPLYVSRAGAVFFACVVAFWVYCIAARVLTPQSAFGKYLETFDGMTSIIFGSCVLVGIAWVVAKKLGHPFAKWERDSGPE